MFIFFSITSLSLKKKVFFTDLCIVLNYINKPLNVFVFFPSEYRKNECGNQTHLSTVADDINAQVTARGTVFCFFTYIECDSVKTDIILGFLI